ncbi:MULTISPECIES: ATP-binding protein [unclassified Mesorhizobium]|uniref:ATP-binding protein n=1 Tax=unclassified Mesorhizobium TaxID=325217 RepID=UPI00112D6F0E|nr:MULTISPECIES: ATP-binding protein [unclassified Mesorhizobium]MBZ9682854.1 HAMP domain-containing histidine kinase [Mesorhizobium sp. CO1-1-2]MBZ9726029.1 HAMP domain-containing histidine kinase [Mesorhizobium sp. CO1-1-11]MBZ9927643.1 HAMP domain-containing histidine kinase [Mesorhizobium sp. BR1-1-4]TPK80270.1 HAMP domain-containing histidine kinase [Mesorhizobium sp. B2-4-18]
MSVPTQALRRDKSLVTASLAANNGAVPNPEATNRKNLFLLIQLRWLAVAGQVLTILATQYWFEIPLPLAKMAGVVLFLVGLNIFSLLVLRGIRPITNTQLFVALIFDMAALTTQLYLSGGASNPFVSLYLLQITLGAALLTPRFTWILVAAASACFVFLIFLFQPIAIPHHGGSDLLSLHIRGMFICFVLAAGLIVIFMTRIDRNLRERDAYLADLRQRSAEEDHIVRMGLLASGAAHELGTPLATISVILSDWRQMRTLARNRELAADMAEMRAQIERCKRIVSGILMSSGQARGEGTIRTTIRGFLDDLVEEWRISRQPFKLEYTNDFDPDEQIVSDTALKQVIFNVFDNAQEASQAWVGVTAERQGDKLVIAVSDRGPGFDETILAALGQPYMSSKGRPGGGLGLFLVVNVVRKLGGDFSARNMEQGACVTLSLPLAALTDGDDHEA